MTGSLRGVFPMLFTPFDAHDRDGPVAEAVAPPPVMVQDAPAYVGGMNQPRGIEDGAR